MKANTMRDTSIKKTSSKRKPSITTILTLMFAVIFLLISIPAALLAMQFAKTGVKQAKDANTWLLESYMSQIDRELDIAERYTSSLIFQNSNTIFLTDRNPAAFFYSSNDISADIRKQMLNYQYLSGFFLYVPTSDFFYTYMADQTSLNIEEDMRDYIARTFTKSIEESSEWKYVMIDGRPYLMQGKEHDGIYAGAFLNVNALPQPEAVAEEASRSSFSSFADSSSGNSKSGSSDAGDSVTIRTVHFVSSEEVTDVAHSLKFGEDLLQAYSSLSPLATYEIASREETMSMVPFLQRYAILFLIEVCLLLALCYLALKQLIADPLVDLKTALEAIDRGNLDYHLAETGKTEEVLQIEQTFNHMTRDIKDLKIEVYEEQIQTQKTKLQNLTYQLRPHFLVNSLNMVYNLIVSGDSKNAMKLIRFSIKYLRYLLGNEADFAPLQAELEHLKNYLGIQMLRYENLLEYEFKVDPFVEDIDIPSMLLQNFIENSVKYSVSPDRMTKIQIFVDYIDVAGTPSARIMVRDNGTGYPEWLLDALAKDDMDALSDRIGLRNNLMRIHMLFHGKASYRFYNQDGAVVEFTFPI